MNPKLFICCALLFAASTSACMQADLTGEETGFEQEAAALPEQPDELAAIEEDASDLAAAESEDQSLWFLADEESHDQDDGAVTEAGCLYVQYCNKPNSSWGTICVYSNPFICSWSAAVAECKADARYVCGKVTYPAALLWEDYERFYP